jgi:hypothetical protein
MFLSISPPFIAISPTICVRNFSATQNSICCVITDINFDSELLRRRATVLTPIEPSGLHAIVYRLAENIFDSLDTHEITAAQNTQHHGSAAQRPQYQLANYIPEYWKIHDRHRSRLFHLA